MYRFVPILNGVELPGYDSNDLADYRTLYNWLRGSISRSAPMLSVNMQSPLLAKARNIAADARTVNRNSRSPIEVHIRMDSYDILTMGAFMDGIFTGHGYTHTNAKFSPTTKEVVAAHLDDPAYRILMSAWSGKSFFYKDWLAASKCSFCRQGGMDRCRHPACEAINRGGRERVYVARLLAGQSPFSNNAYEMVDWNHPRIELDPAPGCCCTPTTGTCLSCGESTTNEEGRYCLYCQSNMSFHCAGCGEHKENGSTGFLDHLRLCQTCYASRISECRTCGNMQVTPVNEEVTGDCPRCKKQVIKEWNEKPKAIFHHIGVVPDIISPSLFMGTEIEIEMKPRFADFTTVVAERAMKDLNGHAYFKKDSSIANGFELVTHPGTYTWWMDKDNPVLKSIGKLSKTCESFWPETTGQHIHLSRNSFKDALHLSKFMNFFDQNKLFVSFVAERHNEEFAFYDPMFDREHAYRAITDLYRSNHHAAVTTYPEGRTTIEVRVFKGNLRRTRILKNIQFVTAVWLFTSDNTGKYYETQDELTNNIMPKMTAQAFKDFVTGKIDLFPDLEAFIRNYRKEE